MEALARNPEAAELARLPFRPGKAGQFRWHVQPDVDLAAMLVAIGEAMRAVLTPDEIRSCGPRALITIDLTGKSAHLRVERIDEAS